MAFLERDAYLNAIKEIVGNDTSDKSIKFLEDMTETYDVMDKKTSEDAEYWKKKCEEDNEFWRKTYSSRFFTSPGAVSPDVVRGQGAGEEEDNSESILIEDLFK